MSTTSIVKRISLAAFVALLAVFTFSTVAQAQSFRINLGCPSKNDPAVRTMTTAEMNCRCFQSCDDAPASTPKPTPADSNSVLNCGQHRALAIKAMNDPSYVEGLASQAVVGQHCKPGIPDSTVPSGTDPGANFVSGAFRYERGYDRSFSGRKGQICQRYYSGTAFLNNGWIEFSSGGHTWRGRVLPNSHIAVSREGITPRPKNPTSISGPITDAYMYNGYCGSGYFRLYFN